MKGVDKYGTGKWKDILEDPEFEPYLRIRSRTALKDRYRKINLNLTLDKFKQFQHQAKNL
jgi:hypothetical protein